MKSCKQLLTGAVCVLMLGTAGVRAADSDGGDEFSSKIASGENVVLFKIHDVVPQKDEQGIVTECEFGLTFYNRSPKSIDAATINLNWSDEGIASVIAAEDKIEEQNAENANQVESLQQATQPKTADFETDKLSTSVILPQIKPFRQVSLKSKIKSDRCFLMLEDADFSFSACSVTDQTPSSNKRLATTRTQAANNCKNLFRFVSPRDPEYYREFQKVSFNEEAKRREENRKKDVDELETSYQKMLDGLNSITTTLESIK